MIDGLALYRTHSSLPRMSVAGAKPRRVDASAQTAPPRRCPGRANTGASLAGGASSQGPRQSRPASAPATFFSALVVLLFAGCQAADEPPAKAAADPEVTCVRPEHGSVRWTVRQPGYIEAFEETPIFPKIMGYVETWHVDIGDRVQKGDVLAELWVPDLVGELREKEAEVAQARKAREVAQAQIAVAATLIDEAKAGLGRAKAELAFSKTQYERIGKLEASVIEKQVKTESLSQLRGREATTDEARAKVAHAEAALQEAETVTGKCEADIAVAEAARDRLRTLVDYATLRAPFDGIVTRRNVHTGDFVQPPAGDNQQPLYVLQRRDIVRVFVDVPEKDAVWLKNGMAATVFVAAVNGLKREGEVTRMAYSLKPQSRTLLAEIDLSNADDLLRPGLYVAAEMVISRDGVLTLPASAIATGGDVNEGYHSYCYLLDSGQVHRCEVEIGSRGEDRFEIVRKKIDGDWTSFTGDEQIVSESISALSDGQRVVEASRPKAAAEPRVKVETTGLNDTRELVLRPD